MYVTNNILDIIQGYEEELRAAARTTLKPELDNVDSNKIGDVNVLPTTTLKTEVINLIIL